MSIYANHLFMPGAKNNSWSHLYEYVNDGDRVLDVGCSTGRFGEALVHLKGCNVTGIDIDQADIKEAATRITKALVLDINDTATYPRLGKFDVIIFADVLEHLVDPRTTLLSAKKLLTPKGRIIFSIPNMAHSSVRLDLLQGNFPYKERGLLDNTHLHFYDMDEAMSIFTDSGYTINAIDPVISKYPYELMKQKLSGTGVRISRDLENYLRDTNGDVFQIVGSARVETKKTTPRKKNRNYVMPQDEMYEYINKLQAEKANLERRLAEVFQSSSWKATAPLRKVKAALKKRK